MKKSQAERGGIAQLGKLASGVAATFTCRGSLVPDSLPVKVYYEQECDGSRELRLMELPPRSSDLTDVQALAAACSQATFGKGTVDVLDPSYRKALKLASSKFASNFDLAATNILANIASVMMPDGSGVRALLDKPNIYGPGDYFKVHVDTPRDAGMFGLLVVCLPCEHTGRELLVPHNGTTHEIKEVHSGYRITITYNLHADSSINKGPLTEIDTSAALLHSYLKEALANPGFMAGGGLLGFGWQHAYPHTDKELHKQLVPLLKGADAVIYATARNLGPGADLNAVWDTKDLTVSWSDEEEEARPEPLVGPCEAIHTDGPYSYEDCGGPEYQQMLGSGLRKESEEGLVWCIEPSKYQLGMAGSAYGNEPSIGAFYCAAFIRVSIPAWGSELRG
ncbi:hypothetical protein WJX72_007567 [[Myrmecia] bisecta]|uniref:Fe2OG dioxygenase domain-containing protein n=1 Tax=[Myrmecia] bisecta TaxID=41462 RepID=A0AAW1P8G4_9CHLO